MLSSVWHDQHSIHNLTSVTLCYPGHSSLTLSDMQAMLILLLSCSMLVIIVVRQPQICI